MIIEPRIKDPGVQRVRDADKIITN